MDPATGRATEGNCIIILAQKGGDVIQGEASTDIPATHAEGSKDASNPALYKGI